MQARLDYWFISTGLTYQVRKVEIRPGILSDHSLLTLNIEILDCINRGKGYWKFNNDLLQDKNYVNMIKSTINDVCKKTKMSDKNLLWEYTKCQIRTDTISYAIKRAKTLRDREEKLTKKLQDLEKNLNGKDTNYMEYKQCKLEWENIVRKKVSK